jgi:UDP-glucose 4-epimerase
VSSTGALVAVREGVVDERHPTLDVVEGHPAGHYGASKAMSEIAALAFARVQGLDVVVLRFPSVYGFGTPHETYLAQAVHARAAGRSFTAPVGGNDRRDYLYVLDAADALARAVDVPASALRQRLFMIGLGRLHTDRDVAALLDATIGEGFSPVEASLDCIRADYDISAAKRDLGFVPRYSLERGLRDYLEWVQAYLRFQRAEPR